MAAIRGTRSESETDATPTCHTDHDGHGDHGNHPAHGAGRTGTEAPSGAGGTARDPVCGMVVNKDTALRSEVGGRTYYFCSTGCQRTFEAPDDELRRLKRRVTIAVTGVLVLAIMRVAVFLGLAAGATLLTWAPIDALPWFTWGVWMMIRGGVGDRVDW